MLAITLKPRRCKQCREKFAPELIGQIVHRACIQDYMAAVIAKRRAKEQAKQRAAAKVDRAKTKARRRALETIPELIAVADKAFSAFIRARDRLAGLACISSGRPLDWSGNEVDAGHYRSRGAASHLRFNEDNCHAQSKKDNRYLAGNAVDYRIGLIARIGLARVEALEADNGVHKWRADELRAIAATYKVKLKALPARAEVAA